ncbi:hypothetical protein VNI00_006876 [Paramarasmius palmivorus]|uniref:Uncharacterized protein n=1 Tax=Paramarasmius palmivorus TaxID=297713 RepID=A0AAW0D823_9AGAR
MALATQFDEFVIDDTSPTVVYSPSRDTFGQPDYLSGWNPVVDGKGIDGQSPENVRIISGSNITHHISSREGKDVFLSVTFQGMFRTYIQLIGDFVLATYDTAIDNQIITNDGRNQSNDILATVQGLSNGNHTISLINVFSLAIDNNPPTYLEFDKAVVRSPILSSENRSNVTLDPTNEGSMTLSGGWSSDSRFHQSNTAGDKARTSFTGVSLQVRGTVSPNSGNYSVTLDGSTYRYTARSSFTTDDTLLFHAGNLSTDTVHSLEITNEGGGLLILSVNGTTATAFGNQTVKFDDPNTPPEQSSSPRPSSHIGAIVGGVLGGVVLIVIIIVVGVFLLRKRRRKHQSTTIAAPFSSESLIHDKPTITPFSSTNRRESPFAGATVTSTPVSSKSLQNTTRNSPSLQAEQVEGAVDLANMRNELANLRETVQFMLSSRQDDTESQSTAPPAYRSSVGSYS